MLRGRDDLATRLGGQGLYVQSGPFTVRIRSRLPQVRQSVALLYDAQCFDPVSEFADFDVTLASPLLRRLVRPQVQFFFDATTPFKPLPLEQAFAMLEWGLNWCVSSHAHGFLILHAGVVEKGGLAAILPAPPGSGKSTLVAGLINRGWRLLSDELALIDRRSGMLHAMPRPVSLKNQSIEIIRAFVNDAVIGTVARDTAKGTVAHLKPPRESIKRMLETARPGWIIFPQWRRDAKTHLSPWPKARSFMRLAEQGFNYSLLGATGFQAVASLVQACDCFEFTYSELDEAISVFARLTPPQ